MPTTNVTAIISPAAKKNGSASLLTGSEGSNRNPRDPAPPIVLTRNANTKTSASAIGAIQTDLYSQSSRFTDHKYFCSGAISATALTRCSITLAGLLIARLLPSPLQTDRLGSAPVHHRARRAVGDHRDRTGISFV